MSFKIAIKSAFRMLGLDIRRYVPPIPPASHLAPIVSSLQKFGIDLVLDVGANQEQFASEIRRAGYTGNIVLFEPLYEGQLCGWK